MLSAALFGRRAMASTSRTRFRRLAPDDVSRLVLTAQRAAAQALLPSTQQRFLSTPNFAKNPALSSTHQRFLSTTQNEETPEKLPPNIEKWANRKSASSARIELSTATGTRENLLQSNDTLIDDITKSDPRWLEAVVKELKHDVPVGSMSESTRNLCHTLMRWLRTRGDSAHIVEDLLRRLIEEEDAGSNHRVNAVLYSIAMDAWAKQENCPDAPTRAEALLQLMQDRHDDDSSRPPPRASHVSQVLAAWSNSPLTGSAERAEQLLHWMESESHKFSPTVHSWTSVIYGYARHGRPEDAERVLNEMEERVKKDPENAVRFNVRTFTAVINAWSHSNRGLHGALMAEKVRKRMEEWSRTLRDDGLRPNVKTLTTLMVAWAKSESPDQGQNAERVWKEILDLRASLSEKERNDPSNRLTFHPYNALMEAWSRCGHPEKAEEVLNGMLKTVLQGDENCVAPTLSSWTNVAQGWAQVGNAKRTEDILKRMDELHRAGHVSAQVNIYIYNSILLAYSKLAEPQAAAKAQRLLDWMEERASKGATHLQPNAISYSTVIGAWKRSKDKRAGKMVLRLVDRMENQPSELGVDDAYLKSIYEIALATVSKDYGENTHVEVLNLLRRIEALHEAGSMGQILSNRCYHIAIASCAWAPDRKGEELAEDILCRMEASPHAEFFPHKNSYDAAITGWARSYKDEAPARAYAILQRMKARSPEASYAERLDKSYNSILAACWASNSEDAPEIARTILRTMREENRKGNKNMRPCKKALNRIYGDRLHHRREIVTAYPVEEMIVEMEESYDRGEGDIEFMFDCYLYALTVCGWSSDPEAASRAEKLWERMNRSTDITPTLNCFNTVLRTYTSHPGEGYAEKAEGMLMRMEREHARGKLDWRPDSSSYDFVIELWAHSKQTGAPQRAFDLLERMDTSFKKDGAHVKPSLRTYSTVLLACALTPAPDEGKKLHQFGVAVRAFNHLRESDYCVPDHSIYNRLLMCAIYLAPDQKTKKRMAGHVFRLCCRDGYVDSRILKHFWTVTSKEDREQLLGQDINLSDDFDLSNVPQEWTFKLKRDSSGML